MQPGGIESLRHGDTETDWRCIVVPDKPNASQSIPTPVGLTFAGHQGDPADDFWSPCCGKSRQRPLTDGSRRDAQTMLMHCGELVHAENSETNYQADSLCSRRQTPGPIGSLFNKTHVSVQAGLRVENCKGCTEVHESACSARYGHIHCVSLCNYMCLYYTTCLLNLTFKRQ